MINVIIETPPSFKKIKSAKDTSNYFLLHSTGHALLSHRGFWRRHLRIFLSWLSSYRITNGANDESTNGNINRERNVNRERYHALCAGLSTVEYGFLYSLQMLTTAKMETLLEKKRGVFKLIIPEAPSDQKERDKIKLLIEQLIITMKIIENSHKKDFFLQIR